MQHLKIVALFAGFAVVLSGCSFLQFQTPAEQEVVDDAMMEKDDAMMEKDDSMMEGAIEDKDDAMMEKDDDAMMEKDDAMMEGNDVSYSGAVLAGSSTKLLDFNQADYEKALAANQNVVLYFYANWCPTCKNEVANGLYPAFNELSAPNTVGFRVNYNDNETDKNEEALAKEFGIAYQHTKVLLKNGERVLKSPTTWSKSEYLEQVTKLAQ